MRATTILILTSYATLSTAIRILCVGETLFDGLPTGIFLGGAPLNAAVHLAEVGVEAAYASCVGNDRLGREARRRLNSRGVDTALIGTNDEYETGFVEVDVDANGDASYTFNTPAAWDYITNCDAIAKAAADADAIVFGSLGSRAEASRAAIRAAASAAKFTVCDVNLRPPFVDDEIVVEAACDVDLLKLNDEELLPLAEALRRQAPSADVDAACEACAKVEPAVDDASDAAGDDNAMASTIAEAAAAIGKAVSASRVVVTRGSKGAVYCDEDGSAYTCGSFKPDAIADTVGAGDSFLAAMLAALLAEKAGPLDALEAGCRCGAFVASRPGATPKHEKAVIASLEGGVARALSSEPVL